VLAFGSSFVATDLELPESTKADNSIDKRESDKKVVSTESSAGWTVGLSHPTLPAVRLAEFTLRNQALGTSGTGRQGFFHHGKRYGHIIDPRSGWPPTHTLSSTVIAESTARADALATAFFVMSIEEISDFCSKHPEIGAVIVRPRLPEHRDKSKVKTVAGNIEIAVFNLDDSQFSILV
jgi:thiamine biosynthesis lipoprotein